jgi:hypothetical protein
MYKFASASPQELIVFCSTRPGYKQVQKWIEFMQGQENEGVKNKNAINEVWRWM